MAPLRISRRWLVPVLLTSVVVVLVAGAGAAATESNIVPTYWRGLWWALSLITTVGFIGEPPETLPGALLSVVLMVLGFLLLAMVSASLAALFVREEEAPRETREDAAERAILEALARLDARLDRLEAALGERAAPGTPTVSPPTEPPDS